MLLVALWSLAACGDDGSAEGSTGDPPTTTAPTTTAPTTSPTTTTPTVDDSGTTGSSSTGRETSGSTTTGEIMLCNGWSDEGPDAPWLELYDSNAQLLASGGPLAVECGGQGSWMFPIYPHMGGWEPAFPGLVFSVEVVVEGFPGPFGSFYDEPNYYYDIECGGGIETFDGGFSHDCIAVLPPDDLSALEGLDGASATIHVELEVDGGQPLVVDLTDMVISAPPDVIAEGCFF